MKYRREIEGPDGWTRWIKPKRRGYRLMCCDCGLVHEMEFSHELDGRGVSIFFRAKRLIAATAAARRSRRHKASP